MDKIRPIMIRMDQKKKVSKFGKKKISVGGKIVGSAPAANKHFFNFSLGQSKPNFIVSIYGKGESSLHEIFFQLQDSCLADCKILLDKTQFCRTVLYVIIKNVVIFVRHLSDKIKYFVSQNEILLVLTDRPALFVKTGNQCIYK